MENWFGDLRLEDIDYYEIAKKVWEDDKDGVIKYAIDNQKEQFGVIVTVPKNISFEDFYKDFDPCVFQDYNPENWKYFEEQYIKDWKYENNWED